MTERIRTEDRATGGLTEEEDAAARELAKKYVKYAMRTEPCDQDACKKAIVDLYAGAGLEKPNVVVMESPLAMSYAYGASAAIAYLRKNGKKVPSEGYDVDDNGAWQEDDVRARIDVKDSSMYKVVRAVEECTGLDFNVTDPGVKSDNIVKSYSAACEQLADKLGVECSKRWSHVYQGGAYWAGTVAYYVACRDVLGLKLPQLDAWERAARNGTFRVMHEDFCIVTDFPEIVMVDEENRPHAEDGPSHRWRDGWSMYHWHGVRLPQKWIEEKDTIDPSEIIACQNVEQRAAGCAAVGWPRVMEKLETKVIDKHDNPGIGELIEMKIPGLDTPGRFLRALCPRNGVIVEGVPYVSDIDGEPIETAIAAQAWRIGDPASEFIPPEVRT